MEEKSRRIILMAWAVIGVLWFIIYQLLAVMPIEASYVIVEALNVFMWMTAAVSVGWLVYPPLKELYRRILEKP